MKNRFIQIRRKIRRLATAYRMYYLIYSLRDTSVAFENSKMPLLKHLEELRNQPPNFLSPDYIEKNLSPIPRHDLGEFHKLTTTENLYKNHPNPKMQDSPFNKYNTVTSNNLKKYEMLFTRISLGNNSQDES